jgi:uncharacterized DUF497 family protein
MEFDWDSANIEHIARHGVTAEEAEQLIQNDPLDFPAVFRNGETRTVNLGKTHAGRILFVVVTERNSMCRVVTARPATKKERAFYAKHKAETAETAETNDQDSTDP